jgi:hypothetical protein
MTSPRCAVSKVAFHFLERRIVPSSKEGTRIHHLFKIDPYAKLPPRGGPVKVWDYVFSGRGASTGFFRLRIADEINVMTNPTGNGSTNVSAALKKGFS